MGVVNLNQDDFKKEVIEYKGTVLVDFYADWCGPCKITGPIIDQLAEEIKEVKFVKINVDANSDLAAQYSIFSIPTFIIFKDGKIAGQIVGAQSKENFVAEINRITGK